MAKGSEEWPTTPAICMRRGWKKQHTTGVLSNVRLVRMEKTGKNYFL